MNDQKYAGFWIRVLAAAIDSILILIVILPFIIAIYGKEYWLDTAMFKGFWDIFFNYILPAIAINVFWVYKSATPGKLLTHLEIIDADSGEKPSTKQFILRYLGYYLSAIPLFIGIIWVGFDARKQGWHDKLAGTVVIIKNKELESKPAKLPK